MDLESVKALLKKIETDAKAGIEASGTMDTLRAAEARITGGPLAELMKTIKQVDANVRAAVGAEINKTKQNVIGLFTAARDKAKAADVAGERAAASTFDPTLPPPATQYGSLHPVTRVQREVERVFRGLGFAVVSGPEMETDFYNFETLNIPADHPARDTQDTFWLTNGWLLRTHTSPCQVRAMQKYGPPLRVIAPGRCFRYEAIDASHENTFFQLEGLLIDKNISIAHLIGFMKLLLREVFQRDVKVRLRPGFFPFVEPGFELDMSCAICNGTAVRPDRTPCATCKKSGWVEILPCGMVHPNVLRHGGIDPTEWTGFAFGLGLTRLAMMKYGVSDIRIMNSGDLRGLVDPARLSGEAIAR